MPGWTLTVDMPARGRDLARLLDGLDQLVADAGGRVYLAKDARLRPELVAEMYPRVGEWLELRSRVDPHGCFVSDLARRLGL
jgi:decaprenylphospho-beta-D-ribofuranose 2-oxidase